MLELAKVTGFEWDSANERKEKKHGVTMAEAEQVFFNAPVLWLDDAAHRQKELRLHALGVTGEGRPLHFTFTLRKSGQLIRVMSARGMHRKERVIYEQSS
jgi:uncharacterized DUF497 family protein